MVAGGAKDVRQPQIGVCQFGKRGRQSLCNRMPPFPFTTTSWILDPMIDPAIIDVMIDVEPNVQTVLQVRHALNLGNTPGSLDEPYCQSVQRWLQSFTTCNSLAQCTE